MKPGLKKWLKRIGLTFGGLILSLVLFLLAVNLWPSILLNDTTLKLAVKYLHGRGIEITYKTASLTAKSKTFWVKEIRLTAEAPCVDMPKPIPLTRMSGCAGQLNVYLEPDVRRGIPNKMGSLPNEVRLFADKVVAHVNAESYSGKADLKFRFPTILVVNASADLGGGQNLTVQADSEGEEKDGMNFFIDAVYNARPRKMTLHVEGTKRLRDLEAKISYEGLNLVDKLERVKTGLCGLKFSMEPPTDHLTLDCPAEARFAFPRAVKNPIAKLVKPIQLKLFADLKRDRAVGEKENPVTGRVGLSVDALLPQIREGSAAINVDVGGLLSQFPKLKYDVVGSLTIEKFEKIVGILSNTEWEIPAPLNVLKGPLALTVDGKGKEETDVRATFELSTKLASRTQRIFSTTKGEFRMPPRLTADVNLDDVSLVLPDIEVRTPPELMPDSRFTNLQATRTIAKTTGGFQYEIRIRTPAANPIRLAHPISKTKVPIRVNMLLGADQPATGKINVDTFTLELFRREAKVEYFELIAATQKTETEVKGKVNFYYTDYTISLYIDGLADRPRTRLVSDPPLPEKQVVAVLLFGKPMEELDSDQMNSVGNTRSALVDGALTLASMYALASTPVESVGYDPATKVFSAKLRLADGTSFNLKSDTTQVRQLGIRKRLGPNWGINSYLEDPFEATKRSLTTLLEWNFLY